LLQSSFNFCFIASINHFLFSIFSYQNLIIKSDNIFTKFSLFLIDSGVSFCGFDICKVESDNKLSAIVSED